jgi:hypothetical protein
MNRSEVKGLYYITPIENIESILKHGIVCFNRAKKLKAKSVADQSIQARREKVIPGTNKKLHDFANLYFNPRNPMMYKRQALHEELCILRIDETILDEPDVIITDGNASSKYTRFEPSPDGIRYLESEFVFAKYRTSDDIFEGWKCKRRICAEVLVPERIPVGFIIGIYVSCTGSQNKAIILLGNHSLARSVSVKPELFFQ